MRMKWLIQGPERPLGTTTSSAPDRPTCRQQAQINHFMRIGFDTVAT